MKTKKKTNPFRWPVFRRYHNPVYDEELLENPAVWAKKHPREADRLLRQGKITRPELEDKDHENS